MNIKQLNEKLKKIIIEPQIKDSFIWDEMEDESGLNIEDNITNITEEGAAVSSGGFSAQAGTAPTPGLKSGVLKGTTVNGIPVEGKSSKKKKKHEAREVFHNLKSVLEAINDAGDIGLLDTLAQWITKNNFKVIKATKGIKYLYSGNYDHVISFDTSLNKLTYIIFNKEQTIVKNSWYVYSGQDMNDCLEEISQIKESYE